MRRVKIPFSTPVLEGNHPSDFFWLFTRCGYSSLVHNKLTETEMTMTSNINRRRSKPLHISVFLQDATRYLLEKTDADGDGPPSNSADSGPNYEYVRESGKEISTPTMEINPND